MITEQQEDTLRRLEASGLRGRGGGWFETHRKWRAVLAETSVPLVVANGGEGEPGSIKDRFVMRTRPREVLLGLKLAMETLGAEHGYVYLKGSFLHEEKGLGAALQEMGLRSLISIHRGDDTYVGGEETALLESIEGRIAWPREKPPRPTAVGLYGRPTLVQNVDTLVRVPEAVRAGSAFAASGTLTVTIWGDVHSPGAYEVKTGRTLRSVIEREGGGATARIGFVFPNGAQSAPLAAIRLDVPLDAASLAAEGSALGTASILVLDEETPPHAILESIASFFEREACGQCPPCVLGTANLKSLITGDRPVANRLSPQAALRETASFMSMHGYCSHARSGALAVTRLFTLWQGPILEHLRSGKPQGGVKARDPFAPNSKELRPLDEFLRRL